jgi:uncharacterized protein
MPCVNWCSWATFCQWRGRHAALACTLVRGNHDLRAGDPPSTLAIQVVNEPYVRSPFALRHTPMMDGPDRTGLHVMAGHVHPVFQLQGLGRQRLRLPCFYITDKMTLLPSFGEFTGGHAVQVVPASRTFITDGTGLWQV